MPNQKQKKNLIIHLLILASMLGIILVPSFYVLAQFDDTNLNELHQNISAKKSEINSIETKISKYKSSIRKKQQKKSSLANELSLLDDQINKSNLEIEKIQIQVNQINLEIQVNEKDIIKTTNQINKFKNQIGEFIRSMNRQDDKNILEVVVYYDSLSDFFSEITYLENLEGDLKISLDQVKLLKEKLDQEKKDLSTKQQKLIAIKKDLVQKKIELESNQTTKNYLLEQTKKDEWRYQRLLKQEKAEYEKTNNEIAYLEKKIREKMAQTGQLGDVSKSGLIWPVPSKIITAYFHDPDYPYRHIFEHPAIDIRASQGTPVKAAASGYVARAKNNGMGYSYIMLVHDKGLSTVYGHVSQIIVPEDSYVVQGQTIGYSGGMPGTPGAGRLTTGPHLHFEVRLNGIPVNPLNYLSY